MKKEQAKAISLVVRKSHEVADIATKSDINDVKRDIEDVRKELSVEISCVKRDIADVRKDLTFEIADARKEAAARADRTDAQIALLRKDVESTSTWLLIKMGSLMLAIVGSAAAFLKFF